MKQTFNKGEVVEEEGSYICVPCGYRHHLKKGDYFTECLSCMAGTKGGHDDYIEGLELWEKIDEASPRE
ncbi:MAG: hypothetical protein V1907_01585 [Candidatus Kerfeldbacteria bacterium]